MIRSSITHRTKGSVHASDFRPHAPISVTLVSRKSVNKAWTLSEPSAKNKAPSHGPHTLLGEIQFRPESEQQKHAKTDFLSRRATQALFYSKPVCAVSRHVCTSQCRLAAPADGRTARARRELCVQIATMLGLFCMLVSLIYAIAQHMPDAPFFKRARILFVFLKFLVGFTGLCMAGCTARLLSSFISTVRTVRLVRHSYREVIASSCMPSFSSVSRYITDLYSFDVVFLILSFQFRRGCPAASAVADGMRDAAEARARARAFGRGRGPPPNPCRILRPSSSSS